MIMLVALLAAAPKVAPVPKATPVPIVVTAPTVEQDAAGNRIEPLILEPSNARTKADDEGDAYRMRCTADRKWCALIIRDVQSGTYLLNISDGTKAPGDAAAAHYDLMAADDDATFSLWPHIVRLAPATESSGATAYVGVETRVSAMYSGGGASASRLSLIRVDSSGYPPMGEVLDIPLTGSATIRACFSEEDMKQRSGACHDEYGFESGLTLAPPLDGRPVFNFQTRATRFPGPVSRHADSLSAAPLTKKDLVTVNDPMCSYHRTVRFNPATDRYEFDTPGPDCSEFTVP